MPLRCRVNGVRWVWGHKVKIAVLLGVIAAMAAAQPLEAAQKKQAATTRSAAASGGLSDAVAGLEALNTERYDDAVRLFTRALQSGKLSASDRATAYYNRGLSHYAKGHRKSAATDFRSALKIKPDDADAKLMLQASTSATPPTAVSGGEALRATWGPLAAFHGLSWIQTSKSADFYVSYEWTAPGLVLSFSGRDRNGYPIAGRYQLDPTTRKIQGQTVHRGKLVTTGVEITPDGLIESPLGEEQQIRQVMRRVGPQTYTVTTERMRRNSWTEAKVVTLAQATPQMILALGWTEASAGSGQNFMQQLGAAIKEGAVQGLAEGIRDAAQARTRGALAPKAFPQGQESVTVKNE